MSEQWHLNKKFISLHQSKICPYYHDVEHPCHSQCPHIDESCMFYSIHSY